MRKTRLTPQDNLFGSSSEELARLGRIEGTVVLERDVSFWEFFLWRFALLYVANIFPFQYTQCFLRNSDIILPQF